MLRESETIAKWLKAGHTCCLAIVTKTWGSAPRAIGSLMIIRDDSIFEGSVSGGCVESSVISESTTLIGTKQASKRLSFSVANEDAWQVGLACGGEIEILLVCMSPDQKDIFTEIQGKIRDRHTFGLSINTETGDIELMLSTVKSGFDKQKYCLPVAPRRRLIIIGAVHIAQKLCEIGNAADYDITVIDPRAAFIEERHFADATIENCWPDEFFINNETDNQTAVVALTHDPKIDDIALKTVLESDVFYIGALGSRKTHASRVDRLTAQGINADTLEKIKGPIGLNIGAKSPAEIAIAIMAEVTLAYHGAKSRGGT